MKLFNIKKLAVGTALGVVALLGTTEFANAQGRGHNKDWKDDKNEQKQERKVERQEDKNDRRREDRVDQRQIWAQQQQQQQQIWAQQQRQQQIWAQQRQQQQQQQIWAQRQRQQQILMEQQRQAELYRQNTWIRSGNDRSNGNGYYNGNANANSNRDHDRYRVYRDGSYYNTDQRGAELLRQAVTEGYRQGFRAGRNDLDGRRRISYSNSNIYQSGTYGYQSYVSQSQYQYYFRQGFQRGYQDGANSRYRDQYNDNNYGQYNNGYGQDYGYDQQYQYGSSNNGVLNILGTILSQILNIRSY